MPARPRTPEKDWKPLETVLLIRNFEIGLFWTRGAYYWAFQAVAFAGFTIVAEGGHQTLALLLASFGTVSSLAWSLANRGSKFWQDVWQERLKTEAADLLPDMFETLVPPAYDPKHHPVNSKESHEWLRGRRFSVTAVATAVSDFVLFLWVGAFAYALIVAWWPSAQQEWLRVGQAVVFVATLLMSALMILGSYRSEKVAKATASAPLPTPARAVNPTEVAPPAIES